MFYMLKCNILFIFNCKIYTLISKTDVVSLFIILGCMYFMNIIKLLFTMLIAALSLSCTENSSSASSAKKDSSDLGIICENDYVLVGQNCMIDTMQDQDRDGVPDAVDNCITVINPAQNDCDQDNIGDVCDQDRKCSATLTGSVNRFNEGELGALPAIGVALEVEGIASRTQTDEFALYTLHHLPIGTHSILLYNPVNDDQTSHQSAYLNPPIARFSYEVQEEALAKAVIKNWLIKPPGLIGGQIQLQDHSKFLAQHGEIGVYIKEIPSVKTQTSPVGYFVLPPIPEGEYTLKFVKENYEPLAVPITVIGLTFYNVNQDQMLNLALAEDLTPWRYQIEVVVTQAPVDLTLIQLNTTPLFPQESNDGSFLTLRRNEVRGEKVVFLSDEVNYMPHEVFNIYLNNNELVSARLFNIDKANDQELSIISTRASEVNVNSIADRDDDGIVDQEDDDLDGDLCLNEFDRYPYDPYQCLAPNEAMNDREDESLLIAPYNFLQADYGNWSIDVEDPLAALISVSHASLRYPYVHAYRQAALSIVQPQMYHLQFPNETDSNAKVTLRLSALIPMVKLTPNTRHYIMATRAVCPAIPFGANLNDEATFEKYGCGMQKIEINPVQDCIQNDRFEYQCDVSLDLPAIPSSQSRENLRITDDEESEVSHLTFRNPGEYIYRVWVYQENDSLFNETLSSCSYCFNMVENFQVSLYAIARRHYLKYQMNMRDTTECSYEFVEDTFSDVSYGETCFPYDALGPMIPLQCQVDFVYSSNARPLILTHYSDNQDYLLTGRSIKWFADQAIYQQRVGAVLNSETLMEFTFSDGHIQQNTDIRLDSNFPRSHDYCWGKLP